MFVYQQKYHKKTSYIINVTVELCEPKESLQKYLKMEKKIIKKMSKSKENNSPTHIQGCKK